MTAMTALYLSNVKCRGNNSTNTVLGYTTFTQNNFNLFIYRYSHIKVDMKENSDLFLQRFTV